MHNKNIYYYSILGYGDNLISLGLLKQAVSIHHKLKIIGTGITSEILDLLGWDSVHLERLIPNHAQFYTLRNGKLASAASDLLSIRAWSTKHIGPKDTVILERMDLRSRLMLFGVKAQVIAPTIGQNVYADRSRLISEIVRDNVLPKVQAMPAHHPTSVIINPASRQLYKDMKGLHLEMVLDLAKKNAVDVTLLDLDGRFNNYSTRVSKYVRDKTTLLELKHLMLKHDLYIGPDSFMLHLAHYLNMPFFVFAYDPSQYFMPLGVSLAGAITFLDTELGKSETQLSSYTGWL